MPHFRESLKTHRLSNHGPAYMEATRLINERMRTHSTLVTNATQGLELALRARFPKGARIVIPTFSFKATYTAVVAAEMTPIIAPVWQSSWALNSNYIDRAKHDGAIVVAPFGHDMDFESYERLGIPIVYDLAAAWGLDYRGDHLAVYSFHATKNFCVGEGGCVVSRDYDLIQKVVKLSNFGHTNAKLSEIQCAIAIANLHGEKRGKHLETHTRYLKELPTTNPSTLGARDISLLVFSFHQSHLYRVLANDVFEARRYYYPLLEDLYPQSVCLDPTPLSSTIRTTVALPRDVTSGELRRVLKTLKTLGCGAE